MPRAIFEKKFLAACEGDSLMTMDFWAGQKASAISGDMILQMDIEGDEWSVLLNMSDELLDRFRIIVLELHGMERVFDPFGYRIVNTTLTKLLRKFNVVHLHPNTSLPVIGNGAFAMPCVLETTLLRKDRGTVLGHVHQFPHPLDVDCEPKHASEVLPEALHAPASAT